MRATFVCAEGTVAPRGVRAPITAAARALAPAGLRVHVVWGDDALLRRLNRRFRRRDRATDVLSFRYAAGPRREDGPDGEIYVSLQRATRQAADAGHGLAQEAVLLVLHGLLHLQGHDHHKGPDRVRMHAAETNALRALRRRWKRFDVQPMVTLSARRDGPRR